MSNSSANAEMDEGVSWIGSEIVRTRTVLPKQWRVREKRRPLIENSRYFQVIPQGSGGSYCQGEKANFGQDTNIDPLTGTVTEPVVLLVTTATLSSDNCSAVPGVIISNSDTSIEALPGNIKAREIKKN